MIHLLVVHASTSPRQGGTLTFLRGIVSRLSPRQFRVTMLFLEPGGVADDFARDGFDVVVVEAGRMRRPDRAVRAVSAIRRLIKSRAVTLVFSNGAVEHLYGGAAAWAAGVPAVWYCHGASPGFDPIARTALSVPARSVLTHSAYTRELLGPRSRAKTAIVSPGVDCFSVNGQRGEIRERMGVEAGSPLLTMAGVFMPWKGQDVFIRAAKLVRERVPAARFALVGDAPFERHRPYAEGLRRLVSELGLERAVSFLGFRTDVVDVMAASDVVVHASVEPEPFGIVVLEAMAAGCALVTTALGGAREIVRPGETALVVPPGDARALADACISLLEDRNTRMRLAAAAQHEVRSRFTADAMVAQLSTELNAAMQGQVLAN